MNKTATIKARGGTPVYQGYAGVRQKSPCSDKKSSLKETVVKKPRDAYPRIKIGGVPPGN